jgi:hypothetical protein
MKPNSTATVPIAPDPDPTKIRSEAVAHRGTFAVVAIRDADADETAMTIPIIGANTPTQAIASMTPKRLNIDMRIMRLLNYLTRTLYARDSRANPAIITSI